MNVPLQQQAVDTKGIPIRPFSDFMTFLRNYIVPKGAIVLFFGTIPDRGWVIEEDLTAPTGYVYGRKL